MKKTLLVLSLSMICYVQKCMSQNIPAEKILTVICKPFEQVSDFLIKSGFEYKGIDTSTSDQDGFSYAWAFHYNQETQQALSWVWTYRYKNSDTVISIKEFISNTEYLRVVKILPSVNFTLTHTFPHADWMEQVYEHRHTVIDLKTYFKTDELGRKTDNLYEIEVIQFF
jgi:hypothetical protein